MFLIASFMALLSKLDVYHDHGGCFVCAVTDDFERIHSFIQLNKSDESHKP